LLLERLVRVSDRVSATRSRREKVALLSACLSDLVVEEVPIGVAFLSGELRQGRIGLGYAAVRAVAIPAAGSASLSLLEVDQAFDRIASSRGPGSAALRERELGSLLARATALEASFLCRLVLGELRQGALEGVMADAVAHAYGVTPASVRRAAMLSGDLRRAALVARADGEAGLSEFKLQLFRPVQPMLAQSAADPAEALARLGDAAFELKLDGARVQVHRHEDEVRIYTRQQNEVTQAVPELVEAALRLPARAFVLDGEAIALGRDQRPLPFQVTMRRFGRRQEVQALQHSLPLTCFVFDLLHLDGVDTMELAQCERARMLGELLGSPGEPGIGRALPVPRIVTGDARGADAFLHGALKGGHEGVVAKALSAPYEAGSRGASWLKIKRAHTLDLIVLAAEWGSGRRRGFLSNLHLGARSESGDPIMLGKTFKGMTDELLAWQTAQLLAREVGREGATVYVRPELVVEVAFDGLQTSPHYPGGLALRFARIKGYRTDKRAAEADTIETVRALAGPNE
jgi:DNA ligase 1